METVTIAGREVTARSPEGAEATMSVEHFTDLLAAPQIDTGPLVLPDGVRLVKSRGLTSIWTYQAPPRPYRFKWITRGSRAGFGHGTQYEEVTLALPYLVVLVVFEPAEHGAVQLSHRNECFFRVEPLRDLRDPLYYPALLNCSRFEPEDGHPLSWICTAKLDRSSFSNEPDTNTRLRAGLRTLLHHLLETGFNRSSDFHEASSWFTESARVDPRIASVEAWQKATRQDKLFVLDVPWLPTGKSLGEVIERIFAHSRAHAGRPRCSGDLARLVFNHQRRG